MPEKQIKRKNKGATGNHRLQLDDPSRHALDIVGPLTSNHRYKYILTFQDNLTKFSKAISIPNQEAIEI